MNEKEKNVKETLEIIRKILDYNKNAQNLFYHASKADKRKSGPNIEKSITERVKLKNNKIAEIRKEEKTTKNKLFKHCFINYQKPSDMYKKLCKTEGERNKNQVYLIKKVLNKIKNKIKKEPENKVRENKKIINIVAKSFEFDREEKSGKDLKTLTPNQMLSRLPITLAQLKAGNNFEKLKNEIRQLLYSLYRSKKL